MGSPKSTPQAQIAVDPNLQFEQAQAQKTLISGLQTEAQGDTAAMMARYGSQLALQGSSMAPSVASPTAQAPVPANASWFTPLLNPAMQPSGGNS